MKKHIKLSLALFFLLGLCLNNTWAQKFSGIATYHSASNIASNISFNSAVAGSSTQSVEITDDMKKQLNKQMQKEYTLKFNATESTWKEVESLESGAPKVSSGGFTMQISSTGMGGLLYKNIAEGNYAREADVFGKPFLVKDNLNSFEWELTGETKKIGDYNVQKAVYTRTQERRSFSFSSSNGEETDSKEETIIDTVQVTAWFTPEIPVSNGPQSYWGLPGLILEVNNGVQTLICSKVVLNPAEGVEIDKPTKGKVVSNEEYQQIQQDKIKEMSQKFSNGSGTTFIRKSGN